MSIQGMPRDILHTIDIYHMPTSDNAQSYPATPDEDNVTAGLVPLSTHKRALMGLDEHNTHELFVDEDVDIREGDKIIVDPEDAADEYRVHNVDKHDYGGHRHKNCVIVPVKA